MNYLEAWAGGHVAPGPHAPRTARRALPGQTWTDHSNSARRRRAWSVRGTCGAARHVGKLER